MAQQHHIPVAISWLHSQHAPKRQIPAPQQTSPSTQATSAKPRVASPPSFPHHPKPKQQCTPAGHKPPKLSSLSWTSPSGKIRHAGRNTDNQPQENMLLAEKQTDMETTTADVKTALFCSDYERSSCTTPCSCRNQIIIPVPSSPTCCALIEKETCRSSPYYYYYSSFLYLDKLLFSQSLPPPLITPYNAAQQAMDAHMHMARQAQQIFQQQQQQQQQIQHHIHHQAMLHARNTAPPRLLMYDEMFPLRRRSSSLDEGSGFGFGWNPFAKKKPNPAPAKQLAKEPSKSPAPPCMAASPPKPPTLKQSRASTSSANSENATLRSSLHNFRFPDSDGPRDSIPSNPTATQRGQHTELPPTTGPATTLLAAAPAGLEATATTPTPTASSKRSKGSKRAKAKKAPVKAVKKLRELSGRLRRRLSKGKNRVKDKVKAKKPTGGLKLRVQLDPGEVAGAVPGAGNLPVPAPA
ncbi:hypothetical protein B0H67DRAFT_553979 [Lasiosphaeris hirsuta]|uniref:Uncharacterized protein n=1 Tax=Lasiosphaeris hirsuta TaxID=260670 RepID=A0AA40DTZ4_9PEZI|nr:hypothetical protein B0H67DRAFT_553979 [Lasiosphaeris hirsuta]